MPGLGGSPCRGCVPGRGVSAWSGGVLPAAGGCAWSGEGGVCLVPGGWFSGDPPC